jgi:hypothetical protein
MSRVIDVSPDTSAGHLGGSGGRIHSDPAHPCCARGRVDIRAAPLALDWLSGDAFIENKGDDWVRSFSFCFAEVAGAVKASRDGNGTPHAGLSVA